MKEYVTFRVGKPELEGHVKRICRSNLKRPAKICMSCPILGPVIGIMEENGWKYNKEALAEPLENYGSGS